MLGILVILVNFQLGLTTIFPKGVVHYIVSDTDYDLHSRDIITSTMAALQREVCLKFFQNPGNNATGDGKVLYIHNPAKFKECDYRAINFNKNIVEMKIGYKCLNTADISRMLSSMIISGIQLTGPVVNSADLRQKFDDEEKTRSTNKGSSGSLLAASDRNYINKHYIHECNSFAMPVGADIRRRSDTSNDTIMTEENVAYFKEMLWPMGIVMYDIEDILRKTQFHIDLEYAMSIIELSSCVVFQDVPGDDGLVPKSLLYFGVEGEDAPKLGFREENQTISLMSMTTGAPGHTAHTLNLLLRALGIPMMSNRQDRDNYIVIHWNNVIKGKEHYLERTPSGAWIRDPNFPYDFDSATHAPANYMCEGCNQGGATVTPAQDHLWQRRMTMGHNNDLSAGDKELLKLLYAPQCQHRFVTD